MKSIFLAAGILFTGFAYAQDASFDQFQQDFQKKIQDQLKKEQLKNNFARGLPPFQAGVSDLSAILPSLPQEFLTSSGSRILTLPQDFMPCIIPEMSQFNMPVVDPKINFSAPGSIPNPELQKQKM